MGVAIVAKPLYMNPEQKQSLNIFDNHFVLLWIYVERRALMMSGL